MARSMLLDRLGHGTAAAILESTLAREPLSGEVLSYPFLAIVDQVEMKTALLLSVINPAIGGVLLIGPRGTGKTTAVRGLVDLMPPVRRSLCVYGCDEEAAETGGMDALCPDCASKFARGERLTTLDRLRLFELPLNARLEDVIGGINERIAVEQHKVRLERGLLAYAHRNLLYIDEVNLLDDPITDAILDAAAQRRVTVRRGPFSALYPSEVILVGSMNPEEGALRPQIQDRFGLRVLVDGLKDPQDRLEVYRRVRTFREHPRRLIAAFAADTEIVSQELAAAREFLPQVALTSEAEELVFHLVHDLEISSHRAELTTLEAARAHAAADQRTEATVEDIVAVAPMALRQRRSSFMREYLATTQVEEAEIRTACRAARGEAQ